MALRYVFSLFFSLRVMGCHVIVFSLCFLSTLYSQWPHEPYSACRCLCQAISAQCPMMSDVKSEPDKNRQGSVWVQGISSVRICTSSDSAVCTLMHSATLAEMRNNPKFRIWSSLKPTYFSQPLPSTLFLPLSSNYRISVSHRMFHGQKMSVLYWVVVIPSLLIRKFSITNFINPYIPYQWLVVWPSPNTMAYHGWDISAAHNRCTRLRAPTACKIMRAHACAASRSSWFGWHLNRSPVGRFQVDFRSCRRSAGATAQSLS